MVKISVITPTVRPKGLDIVNKALKRQEFRDYEWLIGSPDKPRHVHGRWVPDEFELGYWTVNRIYNKLIAEAKGELIVSWQDWTYAKPDALEKFWYHYQEHKNYFVSGVGNKYQSDSWDVMTWKDSRERDDQGAFYPCYFNDIEGNFSAWPKKALYDVGGFDEKLDMMGYGMDVYGMLERVNALGTYDFYLDQTNKSYSLEHERVDDWEFHNLLYGGYKNRTIELQKAGTWPKLSYL